MSTVDDFVREVVALLPEGGLVIALSGGADSAALALAAVSSGRDVRAITVHHHLPGSEPLVTAATEIAARLGLEHSVVDAPGGETETDLRAARLEAIEKVVAPGEWVLTGHTRDDQAETVLSNLLRGAGTGGLGGIPAVRDRWVRPLLAISRERTRAVATAAGLPFVDDPQNEDLTIRRNRLRHEVIPHLEAEFNPNLRDALARTASHVAADDATLAERAAAVPIRTRDDAVMVPAAALAVLPPAVAARVARRALRILLDPYPGSTQDVAAVLDAVSGVTGQIGGGYLADREGPFVVIHSGGVATPLSSIELTVPGAVTFGEWRIEAGGTRMAGLGRLGAVVHPDGPLTVRSARSGDRVAIAGGSKSVADALAEASIPVRVRARWPVVETGGTIVWIVGVRAAPGGGTVGLRARRIDS